MMHLYVVFCTSISQGIISDFVCIRIKKRCSRGTLVSQWTADQQVNRLTLHLGHELYQNSSHYPQVFPRTESQCKIVTRKPPVHLHPCAFISTFFWQSQFVHVPQTNACRLYGEYLLFFWHTICSVNKYVSIISN